MATDGSTVLIDPSATLLRKGYCSESLKGTVLQIFSDVWSSEALRICWIWL